MQILYVGENMNPIDYLISRYCLTDFTRLMPIEIPNVGRTTLAQWFKEWGFKRGAEIGVEAGLYSEVLCKATPELELFCVDAWLKLKYRYWVTSQRVEGYRLQAIERLSPYNCHFIRKWSIDAVKDFKDGELDFVYIDADHTYEATMNDIVEWGKKVRSGGVIAGHDYIHRGGQSQHKVIEAVMEYTKVNKINPWFVLGSKAKKPGEIRDQCRSWMWVKE
jgi:hypothetical protein